MKPLPGKLITSGGRGWQAAAQEVHYAAASASTAHGSGPFPHFAGPSNFPPPRQRQRGRPPSITIPNSAAVARRGRGRDTRALEWHTHSSAAIINGASTIILTYGYDVEFLFLDVHSLFAPPGPHVEFVSSVCVFVCVNYTRDALHTAGSLCKTATSTLSLARRRESRTACLSMEKHTSRFADGAGARRSHAKLGTACHIAS